MAITPTLRQKKLAKEIAKNSVAKKPLNKGQLLEKVGYSKSISEKKPGGVMEQVGVQQALDDLGFTEENAMKVVSEIMLDEKAEKHNRLKASEMVFKVKGTFAPEKKAVVNLNVTASDEQTELIADKYEDELKGKFLE